MDFGKQSRIRIICYFLLSVSLPSCVHMTSSIPPNQRDAALESFIEPQSKRVSLEGTVEIHGGGFAKILGSATADILVGYPNKFLISFRTFFETPGLIVSSDGHRYYYMRMLDDGGMLYDSASKSSPKVKTFQPSELINLDMPGILLGRVNTSDYKLQSVKKIRRSKLLKLEYQLRDVPSPSVGEGRTHGNADGERGETLQILFNPTTKSIHSYERRHGDRILEKVAYEDFVEVDGQWIAQKIDAQMMIESKLQRLKISLKDPVINRVRPLSDYQIARP